MKQRLRVIPLGGVSEVGRNMWMIEYDEDILLIDCGLMFPENDMLGVDLILPDISYLRENKERIRAIVITHGHEDHIGALPYLLADMGSPPIYATRLTQGLISVKLKEAGLHRTSEMRDIVPEEDVREGPFRIEFYRVAHSIPDGVGVIVGTPAGLLVHSGDFKLDYTPVDGRPTDMSKLSELGQRNVLAFLCDCVRIESPGYTPSEKVVGEAFDNFFAQAPGRVIIATFASNISRVQQVLDTAYRYYRKVAVVGRSMENNVRMAQELGYLDLPEDTVMRLPEVLRLPPEEAVILCTGSQGEPMSVLSRIANQDYSPIRIRQGDTVIFSASPIPGNEESIHRVINSLFQQGADVIYSALTRVHVSGHASEEELKLVLSLVKPQFVVPIHGDYRHMALFRKLARSMGFQDEQILLPENGTVMEFSQNYGKITGKISSGNIFVDGLTVGEVGHVVVRDRQLLARDGILMVVVAVDRRTGKVVAGPDLLSRGFVHGQPDEDIWDEARDVVLKALHHDGDTPSDWTFANRKIKDTLGKFFYRKSRRRPMILPLVMEV
ncbi:MAG: ribonuclease J [Chloroflexia bacterium]|nr:ribonuclease J [Chloroflexia bacterium]